MGIYEKFIVSCDGCDLLSQDSIFGEIENQKKILKK